MLIVQPFNMKMVTKDMLQPLLQQIFKMESYFTDTSPEMLSPFIDNCLLCTRRDCTQALLQWSFKDLKNHSKLSLSIPLLQILSQIC